MVGAPTLAPDASPLIERASSQRAAPDPDSFHEFVRSAARRSASGEMSARQAAEDLVAITLVQPVLAQMRETNQAAAPFAPGVVERRFGHMWDAEIARRIVQSHGFGLVDAVARHVQGLGQAQRAGARPEDAGHGHAADTPGQRIDAAG